MSKTSVSDSPAPSAKRASGKLSVIWLLVALAVCGSLSAWTNVGAAYLAHRQIRQNVVEHPEFIPDATTVRIASAGYETVVADFTWLDAIQYIGSNALSAEYKKYLASMLGLVTDLSPKFTYPYEIGLLLLPDVNERYENLSDAEARKHVDDAIRLGEKGIAQTCDPKKVAIAERETDLGKLFSDPAAANDCSDPMIPYYLAYASYWSAHDAQQAAGWYRVTAVGKDAPKGSQIMSAIMEGKSGDRQKAVLMFLSLAEALDPNPDGLCRKATGELRDALAPAFSQGAPVTKELLAAVDRIRQAAHAALGEKEEDAEKTDVSAYCSSYLDKSVREMNLAYVQAADDKYFQRTGQHAVNAKALYDAKAMDFLPRDYQKGQDGYEVIYVWDPQAGKWDFQMGKYE